MATNPEFIGNPLETKWFTFLVERRDLKKVKRGCDNGNPSINKYLDQPHAVDTDHQPLANFNNAFRRYVSRLDDNGLFNCINTAQFLFAKDGNGARITIKTSTRDSVLKRPVKSIAVINGNPIFNCAGRIFTAIVVPVDYSYNQVIIPGLPKNWIDKTTADWVNALK